MVLGPRRVLVEFVARRASYCTISKITDTQVKHIARIIVNLPCPRLLLLLFYACWIGVGAGVSLKA